MLFYIFWGFTAFILLVLIVVVLFTLIRGNVQKRPWKEILKMLFKGVGIVVVTYIVLFYVGGYMFMSSYKKECGPNPKEVEVMKPQAKVITEYILENGVPESMMEIQNLHYVWNSCSKATDGTNVERCFFTINEKDYRAELYLVSSDIYIDIYNKQNETGVYTALEEKKAGSLSIRKQLISYSTKNDGVCNPMRM